MSTQTLSSAALNLSNGSYQMVSKTYYRLLKLYKNKKRSDFSWNTRI